MASGRQLRVGFMSGTGNSLRVASWLATLGETYGFQTKLEALGPSPVWTSASDATVWVFPTHGFTAPWPVMREIARLPWGNWQPALVVATRGGTKLGSLFFPGLDGTATVLAAILFWLRGYDVRGQVAIDMPSNWMALHSGFSEPSARAIAARAKPKTERFGTAFFEGRRFLSSWIAIPLGILIAPISLGYLLVGRIFLGKIFYATDACNGCALCVKTCPHDALVMKGGQIEATRGRPYWTYRCESCMHCMAFCPQKAIEASWPLAAIFAWIGLAFGPAVLFAAEFATLMKSSGIGEVLENLVSMVFQLAVCLLLYIPFWHLMRWHLANKFFTFFTPTRFYHRYHEPDTKALECSGRGPHGRGG